MYVTSMLEASSFSSSFIFIYFFSAEDCKFTTFRDSELTTPQLLLADVFFVNGSIAQCVGKFAGLAAAENLNQTYCWH